MFSVLVVPVFQPTTPGIKSYNEPDLGIYKGRQEGKKTRKHAFYQESDQEKKKKRQRSRKKERKHALDQESDQEKKNKRQRSRKKERKHAFYQESDQEKKKNFLLFLIVFLMGSWARTYFLFFFLS